MGRDEVRELFAELARVGASRAAVDAELAKVMACKGAVKAGQRLSQQEMESLINRLFACSEPYFCPHGRPAIIKITAEELDRRFGR
jgi:DNA mismatch repair protein MutL